MDTPTVNRSASAHAAIRPSTDRGGDTHTYRCCTKPLSGSAVSSPVWCGTSVGRCDPPTARRTRPGPPHMAADTAGSPEAARADGLGESMDTSAVARACAAEGPQFGPRVASRQDCDAPPRRRARAPCRAPGTTVPRPRSRRGDRPRSTGPTHLPQGTWMTSRRTITARMTWGRVQVDHPGERGSRVPRM